MVQGVADLSRGRDDHRGLSLSCTGESDVGRYIEGDGPISDSGTDDGADVINTRTNCVRGQWFIDQ
jgi:hypothetical protein